jgi:ketosteroid isomerase-like protein
MPQPPADVIGGVYEASGRGDIPAILAMIDEHIDWHAPENLPHGGHFQGRDAVGRFFQGIVRGTGRSGHRTTARLTRDPANAEGQPQLRIHTD